MSLEPLTSDRALVLGVGFLGELGRGISIGELFLGELRLGLEIVDGFLEELKLGLVIVEFFCLLDSQPCTRVPLAEKYGHFVRA
jgi:hypothetical protein